MNIKSTILGVSAAISAATVSVFAASAPAHAFLFFEPSGTQLDGDSISDIAVSPGDTIDFALSIDTRGFQALGPKAVSDFTFGINWDRLELGIQPLFSFLAPASPFDTFTTSGNQITLSGGTGIPLGTGLYELGTISFRVLDGLVNDGEFDFRVRYQTSQLYANLEGMTTQDVEVQPIPTPALLPGLVGLGVAALRRKKDETAEENA